MTVLNQLQPAYVANMWNEALNKRLGTKNLSPPYVLVEVEKCGFSFAKLLAIPEQDDWIYNDGKLTSCVAVYLDESKTTFTFLLVAFLWVTDYLRIIDLLCCA
ncbi:hypothetical protein EJD97_012157, partial [Solanum chilense]